MEWIKVEKLTPDKIEIRTVAADCHCTRGDAFLAWFRLWCYLDSVVDADGLLRGYSAAQADDDARLPGIAESLQRSGWLVFSDTGCSIIGWEKHNGKSAKERALAQQRKSREREVSRSIVTKA